METRRRLKFKGKGVVKKVRKQFKQEETPDVSIEEIINPKETTESTLEPISSKTQSKSTFPELQEYIEWGPEINGYRFVSTPDIPQYYKQRHTILHSDVKGSYEWSYLSLPEFVSNAEGHLDKKAVDEQNTDHKDSYSNYDHYFKEWEKIKRDGLGVIVFPVKGDQDLSLENIRSFIQTSKDYTKALKIERIRWHPDKMTRVLKLQNDSVVAEITKCFQLINELWEQDDKRLF